MVATDFVEIAHISQLHQFVPAYKFIEYIEHFRLIDKLRNLRRIFSIDNT